MTHRDVATHSHVWQAGTVLSSCQRDASGSMTTTSVFKLKKKRFLFISSLLLPFTAVSNSHFWSLPPLLTYDHRFPLHLYISLPLV